MTVCDVNKEFAAYIKKGTNYSLSQQIRRFYDVSKYSEIINSIWILISSARRSKPLAINVARTTETPGLSTSAAVYLPVSRLKRTHFYPRHCLTDIYNALSLVVARIVIVIAAAFEKRFLSRARSSTSLGLREERHIIFQ